MCVEVCMYKLIFSSTCTRHSKQQECFGRENYPGRVETGAAFSTSVLVLAAQYVSGIQQPRLAARTTAVPCADNGGRFGSFNKHRISTTLRIHSPLLAKRICNVNESPCGVGSTQGSLSLHEGGKRWKSGSPARTAHAAQLLCNFVGYWVHLATSLCPTCRPREDMMGRSSSFVERTYCQERARKKGMLGT